MFYQLFHKSQREEGQGLVEYSLLITLVALAVTMILLILGDTIEQQFCAVRNELLMVGDPNQTCDSAVAILMINDQGPNTINMEAEVSDPNGDPDDPYATISKVEFYIDEDSGSPVQTEYFYRHCLSGNPSGQPCGNYDLSGLDSGQHTVIAKVYLEDDTVTTSQIGFTK
jgi:Flp pilus assembly pilin Flp